MAILVPSGDHAGLKPLPFGVRSVSPLPSRFITASWELTLSARREESGDQLTWPSPLVTSPVGVIGASPLPFGLILKIRPSKDPPSSPSNAITLTSGAHAGAS